MKILHVITGLYQGGAENALFNLCVSTSNKDITHIVISLAPSGYYSNLFLQNNIKCYHLDMKSNRIHIQDCIKLFNIIKEVKPDILQTWMYHADFIGGLIGKFAGVKSIIWGIHNYNVKILPLSTRIIIKLCSFLSYILPNKIVICANASIPIHLKVGYKNNFETIQLGYDENKFYFKQTSYNEERTFLNIPYNEFVIGCVARWDPQKNHENLLDALVLLDNNMTNLKSLTCIFVGTNMHENNLELVSMIKKKEYKKIKIILYGPTDKVIDLMSSFDVKVLPSLGEAFPNVLAEAMLCKVPCIATNVGDVKEIVNDTGWIVPSSNQFQLYKAIEEAINLFNCDQKNWICRKNSCRNRIVSEFSLTKMNKNYIELWKRSL
jgi:glycosyltransferase involved in cell wall biosynthesis